MTPSWFICPTPSPQASIRLYCFPYAGGSVASFRNWSQALPGIELWIAHLPGRGSRFSEAPFTAMLPLIQALSRHLPAGDQRPFAFFGHSLGARVAFELARSLRRRRQPLPNHLLLSACHAPQLPPDPPYHTLPKAAFLAKVEKFNGLPAEILAEPELLDLLLPTLRADIGVYETAVYHSEPPLPSPITAYGGLSDPIVSRDQLSAWRQQTSVSFQATFFPGDHFYLHTAENQLLQTIKTTLTP